MAAYGPTSLSLPFLAAELAFDDTAECRAFAVGKMGCVPLAEDPQGQLDTRASRRALASSSSSSSVTAAVAKGVGSKKAAGPAPVVGKAKRGAGDRDDGGGRKVKRSTRKSTD